MLVHQFAHVQQHYAAANAGELTLHLVILDNALFGFRALEKNIERGQIPLPVAELAQPLADRVLRFDLKIAIKGATGEDHTQIGVQNDEGFANRVYNRLGKRIGGLNPPRVGWMTA